MNLTNASVVGFFSLPSASLAEHNTEAYNIAMAEAPAGAGTCARCGMGIRHHVIVLVEGVRRFIGTECALKVGGSVAEAARRLLTSDELAAKYAREAAQIDLQARNWAKAAKRRAARAEAFKDILMALAAQQTDFHSSLSSQLLSGALSERQAAFACKAMFGRENKRNSQAWNAVFDRVTEPIKNGL